MNRLVFWFPAIWSAADTAMDPSAAHRKVSEGSLAVCSSIVRAIGLLNYLFRRPVPAEFRRGKVERIEKGGEAAFHLGKGFVQRKLLAQMRLALEPHVLRRILLRGIGSKAQTGDFPVGLGQAGVRLREKLPEFFPSMIAGSVPEKDELLGRIEGLTPLEIRHRVDSIAS